MPAFASHYIFAKEMMPFLKKTADFEINENAVYLGTQGPDVLFFHRVLPWMPGKSIRKYGSMLHRAKPGDIFENMREYCKNAKNLSVAGSYAYGFMLHYILDRNCHPYVYSLQNKITSIHRLTNPHTAHNLIEFAMDAVLLNRRLGVKEPCLFKNADTILTDNTAGTQISKILQYTVNATLGAKIKAEQTLTAFADTAYIQKISYDPTGIKRMLLTPFDTIIAPFCGNFKFAALIRPRDLEKAKKYANIEHNEWKSPYSSLLRNESFEELFELSEKEAKEMIPSFQSGTDCGVITQNKSFLTGVEIK